MHRFSLHVGLFAFVVRVVVLCCAVLCCAVLCCAVLCCVVLCCVVLCCAVLCCVASSEVNDFKNIAELHQCLAEINEQIEKWEELMGMIKDCVRDIARCAGELSPLSVSLLLSPSLSLFCSPLSVSPPLCLSSAVPRFVLVRFLSPPVAFLLCLYSCCPYV